MKPEEFEVYVIPPNFMEGGTLFGGLLKTRNTIEAVILGLAVGVPVLHLPFSLTVRVVILCLTALPLVLLALIGVSGMSLSAFKEALSPQDNVLLAAKSFGLSRHRHHASQPAGAGSRQRQRSQKNRRAAEGTAWRRHHYFSLISSLLG